MDRKKLAIVSTVLMLCSAFAVQFQAGGAGCKKAAEIAAAEAKGGDHGAAVAAGEPCCKKAHAGDVADGKPCCVKSATQAALVALKSASDESGSADAKAAYETALASVERANGSPEGGCPKMRGAAQEAAMAALKQAADTVGCPKAKAAVEAALVAYRPHQPEADAEAAVH